MALVRTAGYVLLAAAAFQPRLSVALNSIAGHVRRPSVTRRSQLFASTNDGDDVDDSNLKQPGMAKAFRLLESLDSLDDPEEYIPAPEKINVDAVLDRESLKDTGVEVAPEKEMAVYIEMVEELEHNDDAEAYAELLEEMGSSVMRTGDDTYSQVLSDLGGTRPATKKAAGNVAENDDSAPSPPVLSSDVSSEASAEQLMENALQEALREVKVNNPRLSASLLDDREIMREIEGIFNQGNERLIANLEDIRREQQALAAASAASKAQAAVDNFHDGAVRMQNAEKSIVTLLKRVNAETSKVEQSVSDLKAANAELDKDFITKLKRGGLPKQGAFAGLVLFSVRSIVDSVSAVSVGDESFLAAALVQGAIAVVCAAIFFFL